MVFGKERNLNQHKTKTKQKQNKNISFELPKGNMRQPVKIQRSNYLRQREALISLLPFLPITP